MCFRAPEVELTKMCPECGGENPMEAVECGDCGAKVRKILQILKHRLSIFCMTISVQVLRRPRKSGQRVGVRVCLL